MRKATYVMMAIFLSGLVSAGLFAQEKSGRQEVKRDTLVFTVYGMDCPGCEGGLEKQVNKIPSVSSSEASWVRQQLKVVVRKDSVLKREDLEFRVKKANFTLEGKKQE
ncbi:MAG: cation transporter [Bacteroidales bacterium]|nr:cation transporter [Bacteroidales bacterium]